MDLPEVTENPKHHPDCCLSLSTRLLDVLTDTFRATATGDRRDGEDLVLSIGSGSGLLEALLLSRWPSLSPLLPQSSEGVTAGLTIEGVEVRASVNRYLPTISGATEEEDEDEEEARAPSSSSSQLHHCAPPCFSTVKGSWDVSPRAREAAAFLFVYPRSPALVARYVRTFVAVAAEPDRGDDDEKGLGEGWERENGSPRLRAVVWLGHRSDWADFAPSLADVPGFGAAEEVVGARAGLVDYEMMAVIRRLEDGTHTEGR